MPDLVLAGGTIKAKGPFDIPSNSGGQFALSQAAKQWTTLWLILKACGWTAPEHSPSSHPVRVSFRHGSGSFADGLISNPRFFELIMGWPIGWTDVQAPVTEWSHWLQRSRGALSALTCSSG